MSEPSGTSKGKKVVKAATSAAPAAGAGRAAKPGKVEPGWTPTPGGKSKATTLRVVAWVLWGVAIALEVVTIVWILP